MAWKVLLQVVEKAAEAAAPGTNSQSMKDYSEQRRTIKRKFILPNLTSRALITKLEKLELRRLLKRFSR